MRKTVSKKTSFLVIIATLCLVALVAWAVQKPTEISGGIVFDSQAATTCTAGSTCIWNPSATNLPSVHKTDNSSDQMTLNTTAQELTQKTVTAQIVKNGFTCTGAAANDCSGSSGAFSTSTGAVSLNGDTTVASGKNFSQVGAGTFSTGTGTVSLNGSTTVAAAKNLTITSGSLLGTYSIAGTPSLGANMTTTDNTFSVGDGTHRLASLASEQLNSGAATMTMLSSVANGGGAIGFILDSTNALSNATAANVVIADANSGTLAFSHGAAGTNITGLRDEALNIANHLGGAGSSFTSHADANIFMGFAGTPTLNLTAATQLEPFANNGLDLGDAAHKWSNLYLTTLQTGTMIIAPQITGTITGTYTWGGNPTIGADIAVVDNANSIGDSTHRLVQIGVEGLMSGTATLGLTSSRTAAVNNAGISLAVSTALAAAGGVDVALSDNGASYMFITETAASGPAIIGSKAEPVTMVSNLNGPSSSYFTAGTSAASIGVGGAAATATFAATSETLTGDLAIAGSTATSFMSMTDGSTAAVSAANTGRIRYNASTQQYEHSDNTAAYTGTWGTQSVLTVTGLTTTGVGSGFASYVSANNTVLKTDNASISTSRFFGFNEGIAGSIVTDGLSTNAAFTTAGGSPSPGAAVYLAAAADDGATGAGKLTATAPVSAGSVVAAVGVCLDNSNYAGAKTSKVLIRVLSPIQL